MSWQLFTAMSVLALSCSVLLQRVLLHRDKIDPYAYAVTFQGIVGVLLTIFALGNGLELPGIEKVWVPALISIIAFGVGHIFYAKTLQRVEASAFSVLFATQAIWIMLIGIVWFHESLTLVQVIGSVLILGSVGLLVKNIRALSLDSGTAFGLITGILFGIAIASWSYVGRHTDGLSWAAVSFIGSSLVTFLARPGSVHKMAPVFQGRLFSRLLLLGAFYAIGSLTMLYAYREGAFSIVTPLRQTSIIITVLLALILLAKERNRIGIKLLAAFICFLGVLLIVA